MARVEGTLPTAGCVLDAPTYQPEGTFQMTHKATYFAPISSLIGSINHAISGLLFEKAICSTKKDTEKNSYARFESSVFSQPDASELLLHEEDIDPLLEAEVFAIYGRRQDAEEVLAAALKAGQLTAGDVTLFWSLRDKNKSTQDQYFAA